jgi:hypothetical protein
MFVGQITRMAHSVLMRCGTSRSSEITSDWDTLLTSRTEKRARLPPQSERLIFQKLQLKDQLHRSRAAAPWTWSCCSISAFKSPTPWRDTVGQCGHDIRPRPGLLKFRIIYRLVVRLGSQATIDAG